MITRICALQEEVDSGVQQSAGHRQPSNAEDNRMDHAEQSAPSFANTAIIDPAQEVFSNIGLSEDILLDDLWSMMDWNVGFPSMDLASAATTPGP